MKKLIISVLTLALLTVGAGAAFERVNTYNNNFTDVKSTAWYAENVKTAYELGFMNGKSENTFDPDGKVSIAEGIAMASRLHAIYNGNKIEETTLETDEFRFDFDENTPFVDLSARNQRLDHGIGLYKSKGGLEDGMLVMTADGFNSVGSYDPGFYVAGLELDTRYYNLIKVRMKRDELPNKDPNKKRNETLEVFFETSSAGSITGDKCVTYSLSKISDLTDWFEVEIDMSKHKMYKDMLNGLRFDTTNNNGKYYIDYIIFTSNGKKPDAKWYEMYADYAVEHGIVAKNQYTSLQMGSDITRHELCDMIAAALPEEYFNPINDIKGIPDIDQYERNADVYLMLYRAGILLGADTEGNFKPQNYIKRSEVSAIINRAAIPENRVRGTIAADWTLERSELDIEFEDESWLKKLSYEAETLEIKDGVLHLKAKERPNSTTKYDPKITCKNVSFNATDYMKVWVRMKAHFEEEGKKHSYDFYFMTDEDTGFSEAKSFHGSINDYSKPDSNGWYIVEVDLRGCLTWRGNVTAFRFDPANSAGTYEIDYIRFIKSNGYFELTTHEELINAGYTATRLLKDEGFETGFVVSRVTNTAKSTSKGKFQDYVEDKSVKPMWNISPHWARYDLVDDRDTETDKYTLKDKHDASTIIYNPEEKSIKMRVNTYPMYEGKPHFQDDKSTPDVDEGNYMWWPHLLLSQDSSQVAVDKKRNSAAADRMFVEIDIRLLDFNDTTIKEGSMSANFMTYFYLRTDKAPGDLIWFGLNFFNGNRVDGGTKCSWAPDSAAHQYMYKIPQSMVFGGVENSFVPAKDNVKVGEEWKHVRVDVTSHIERAVDWANRDNAFGTFVTVEDMYFEGVNIGFETWGNYDYTVEFKNFNMVAYNKD